MRIDQIDGLASKCTGCMACVDICPTMSISRIIANDGFSYSKIDEKKCVDCGRCFSVCPLETQRKNEGNQKLYACYSTIDGGRNRGSSGGIFEILAKRFLAKGYCVCGASFDDDMKLKHKLIKREEDLYALLKSKYVQSDTTGIYKQIKEVLSCGEGVFFCGTPCQVAALKNFLNGVSHEKLFTADIICHGVPSQKIFDMYIADLERKNGGKIQNFSFRVKDNKYKHAHGYRYGVLKNGKTETFNGVYTQSSFYNAFKKYLIFREGCYDCRYATLQRTADITLGDFWGIEKYEFDGDTDAGVSMVITNTDKGRVMFSEIENDLVCSEFPVKYGVESNYCLTHSTKKNANRDEIIKQLSCGDYDTVAQKYFNCGVKQRVYWLIPPRIRRWLRKLRGIR